MKNRTTLTQPSDQGETLKGGRPLHLGESFFHMRNIFHGKPFFTVRIDLAGCVSEVRVNDVPVDEDLTGRVSTVEIPVNQYIFAGANTLEVSLTPQANANAYLADAGGTVEFCVSEDLPKNLAPQKLVLAVLSCSPQNPAAGYESQPSSVAGKFLSTDAMKPSASGDIEVSEVRIRSIVSTSGLAFARTINVPAKFPEWSWRNADSIEGLASDRASLGKAYQNLWSAFRAKRFEELDRAYALKIREMSVAYYISVEHAKEAIDVRGLANNNDLELYPLQLDSAIMQVCGNGRLARLRSPKKLYSPLVYVERDRSLARYIELFFCRRANQWMICR